MTRRDWLKAAAATGAAARFLSGRPAATSAAQPQPATSSGPWELPPLPYAADALEPHIDAQTMEIHHGRHHAAYVDNLNAALAEEPSLEGWTLEDLLTRLDEVPDAVRTAVRNNAGGHANHRLFWDSLRSGGSRLSGDLAAAVDRTFGSAASLQDALVQAGLARFGSGWAWLSLDAAGALIVETTPNQDSPLMTGHRPLLGLDVWEHAYYLRYQNRRAEYLDALFNVIDWEAVGERYRHARA